MTVRRPDGRLHTESYAIADRWVRFRKTFLRGPLALVESVSIALRAVRVAARQTTGTEITHEQILLSFAPVMVGMLGVFVVVPGLLSSRWPGIAGDVIEATSRAAMLVVYLAALARSRTGRRLFGYHGGEHMAIAAFERHHRMPTTDEVEAESPVHPRCGSSFIALFVVAAGVVFSFVERRPLWLGGVLRVALVPVLAVIAYETMRASARLGRSAPGRLLSWPGSALQRLTTRRPAPDQREVAMSALQRVVGAEEG